MSTDQPDAAQGIASNTPCLGCLHQYVSHGGMFGECALCGCTRFKNPDDQPDAAPGETIYGETHIVGCHSCGESTHPHHASPCDQCGSTEAVYCCACDAAEDVSCRGDDDA